MSPKSSTCAARATSSSHPRQIKITTGTSTSTQTETATAMAAERDELLTINQVSELLHIPVQSIYKQRQLGMFCPAYRVGKRLIWRRSELMAWLETKKDPV